MGYKSKFYPCADGWYSSDFKRDGSKGNMISDQLLPHCSSTEQSDHLGSSTVGPFTTEMSDLTFETDGVPSMVHFFLNDLMSEIKILNVSFK